METTTLLKRLEIRHGSYNLAASDNLSELPEEPAVFGVFGIVNEEPVNCRYVGAAFNLQASVKELFERPPCEGLKNFMQGPWIAMLVYEPMTGSSSSERQHIVGEWTAKHTPAVEDDGEYPGYYHHGQ